MPSERATRIVSIAEASFAAKIALGLLQLEQLARRALRGLGVVLADADEIEVTPGCRPLRAPGGSRARGARRSGVGVREERDAAMSRPSVYPWRGLRYHR